MLPNAWHGGGSASRGAGGASGVSMSGARSGVASGAAREREVTRAAHTRPALMLGADWSLDSSSLTQHAALVETVNTMAALVDMVPVWPHLGASAVCATCRSSAAFRSSLVNEVVACDKLGIQLPQPPPRDAARTLALLQCRHPSNVPSARDGKGGACCASRQMMTCQLLPRHTTFKPSAKLPFRSTCYTRGGALFGSDAARLLSSGGLSERKLIMPRALWLGAAGDKEQPWTREPAREQRQGLTEPQPPTIDGPRFAEWVQQMRASASAASTSASRELFILSPPPHGSQQPATSAAVAELVPLIAGAEAVEGFVSRRELHRQLCGGALAGESSSRSLCLRAS